MSAILVASSSSTWWQNRQIRRNVSPLFLLAAPANSSMTPWTISAIWLTKVITLPCNTSVAMPKLMILVFPRMQLILMPSTIAFTPAEFEMLWLTMFAPASPKPNAKSVPSLMIVLSKITVSRISAFSCEWQKTRFRTIFISRSLFILANFILFISSTLNSLSAILMAINGLSLIMLTFAIMVSTGSSTSVVASFEKNTEATHNTTQTTKVIQILQADSAFM
mmetsp:Transcript_19552/g.36038  ORF Transcript_19552/g.36038 Transcript_19552/m.36038 type:complete len:222 (-) Transcript_19552:472-1137(-)